MKKLYATLSFTLMAGFAIGQTGFSEDSYWEYLETAKLKSNEQLRQEFAHPADYISEDQSTFNPSTVCYFDSVAEKMELTQGEIELLKQNHFVVTERLKHPHMCDAFDRIYERDLPIFITTDAILHALHQSYDAILKDIEIAYMEPNLKAFIQGMYAAFPQLQEKYQQTDMADYLSDVDLFTTIAANLIDTVNPYAPRVCPQLKINEVLTAIQNEQMIGLELYTYSGRNIDFSQFSPRGHYEDGPAQIYDGFPSLEPYFRTVKWFSFIEFMITLPESDFSYFPEDIKRMRIDAFLINELIELSNVASLLNDNDAIIQKLVGESDNLTPSELEQVKSTIGIQRADQLLDTDVYETATQALLSNQAYSQKILSGILVTNPITSDAPQLPVAYKIFGDRYILDSYIFQNVIYNRIVNEGQLSYRMMPDPLDAMFVLGNNNALELLQDEIAEYHYGYALDGLRYLVDSYDEEYWTSSLYNTWLQSLKKLNMPEDISNMPFFTKTVAWQHEKLNTQLSSWAQLRHDNLLYAKQSYTPAVTCEFPHGYVEPYPDFYRTLETFASNASSFFASHGNAHVSYVANFWERFSSTMDTLAILAEKEVQGTPFSDWEAGFFDRTIHSSFAGYLEKDYSGWYPSLYYDRDKMTKEDYIVADVHTQSTDEMGNIVGKVLHVGLGDVNMGFFIAPSPSNNMEPTIYAGPTMSYYETITENFERLKDSDWENKVYSNNLPNRPDWVNVYLANENGGSLPEGRKLAGVPALKNVYECESEECMNTITDSTNPNPLTSDGKNIKVQATKSGGRLSVINTSGETVKTMQIEKNESVLVPMPSHVGMYIIVYQTDTHIHSIKSIVER